MVLGLAGDLIVDSEKLTHKHNKAGGRPIFAGTSPPLESSDVICGICGGMLSLAVQVGSQFPSQEASPFLFSVRLDVLIFFFRLQKKHSYVCISGPHSAMEPSST